MHQAHSFQIAPHSEILAGGDLPREAAESKGRASDTLSQSLREVDFRAQRNFVEVREFVQNPQEQTLNSLNSARSKSQDETQHDSTKVSPRSVSLNQSVMNCLICYDKLPDAVLMECGHGGLCYECSVDIWKKNGECYLCRQVINLNHKPALQSISFSRSQRSSRLI